MAANTLHSAPQPRGLIKHEQRLRMLLTKDSVCVQHQLRLCPAAVD